MRNPRATASISGSITRTCTGEDTCDFKGYLQLKWGCGYSYCSGKLSHTFEHTGVKKLTIRELKKQIANEYVKDVDIVEEDSNLLLGGPEKGGRQRRYDDDDDDEAL